MIDIIKKWHDRLLNKSVYILQRPISKLKPEFDEDVVATKAIEYICNHEWSSLICTNDNILCIEGDGFVASLWNSDKLYSGYSYSSHKTGWCQFGSVTINNQNYTWKQSMPSMEMLVKLDILIEQYYLNIFKENTK